MGSQSIEDKASSIATLMERRLRLGGDDLAEKVRRGGRRLPRRVRRAALLLADSAERSQIPKFRMLVDRARADEAYRECQRYLKSYGRAARRRAVLLEIVRGIGLAVFVALVAFVLMAIWKQQ